MTPTWKGDCLQVVDSLVDLVGIEPTTSSMPWKRAPSCATGPRVTELILHELPFSQSWRSIRFQATARIRAASVLNMEKLRPVPQPTPVTHSCSPHNRMSWLRRYAPAPGKFLRFGTQVLGCAALLALASGQGTAAVPKTMPGGLRSGPAAQSASAPPAEQPAPATSNAALPINSLRPALAQITAVLDKVRVDHWKVSRNWKGQLHSDIDSIQQDLASKLPALLAKADASPQQIGPQLAAMQNVNALYDVLVRVSTAASLGGNKSDAGALENAVQELEISRKSAANQLLRAAVAQDQHIAQLQAQVPQNAAPGNARAPKTIVVENDGHRRARHRKAVHKKQSPAKPQSGTKAAAPQTPQ